LKGKKRKERKVIYSTIDEVCVSVIAAFASVSIAVAYSDSV